MPCSLLQLVFWIRDPSSHNKIISTKKRGWLRAYAPGLPKLTCNCRVRSSRLKEKPKLVLLDAFFISIACAIQRWICGGVVRPRLGKKPIPIHERVPCQIYCQSLLLERFILFFFSWGREITGPTESRAFWTADLAKKITFKHYITFLYCKVPEAPNPMANPIWTVLLDSVHRSKS